MEQVRPGLWRWTAPHPDWEPAGPETPGDWPRDVGCVAYAAPRALVLIDPLVEGDAWEAVDALVERHGKPVHVLVTIQFHERSREHAVERYGGVETVPEGVEPIPFERAGETMFWLPEHRALVPGDRLLGFGGDAPLRVCPDSWLRYLANGLTGDELRALLRERLLELPVELILVSHGEPVGEGGREALRAAVEG
jgi:glyoxylase-like metal-dependent hydrolase (beta-lactamase superfamily II)